MKLLLAGFSLLFSTALLNANESEMNYKNRKLSVEERVKDLMSQLTVEEKANLCHGKFLSGGIPRLGIGQISALDGPMGVRAISRNIALDPEMTDFAKIKDLEFIPTTSLPSNIGLACTWNPEAARVYGRLIGMEMLSLKRHILFGPGLNMMRSPFGGRNFEYFGEDPFLTSRIGVGYINGVQSTGVAACAKHLFANDMESKRWFTSSNLDMRTLREIYMPPFEAAAKEANVWTMMEGNNIVNGTHISESSEILNKLLKDEFKFDGTVITDWRSAYEPVKTALGGTDMTLGNCDYVFGNDRLLNAIKEEKVPLSVLDDKARRILRLYFLTGVIDPEQRDPGEGALEESHNTIARRLATETMVLLKNDNAILPIDRKKIKRILVTGPGAFEIVQGRGSSFVKGINNRTAWDGVKETFGEQIELIKLPFDKKGYQKIVDQAGSVDMVLFFAKGAPHGESRDLKEFTLPDNQPQSIIALSKANSKTVVILQTGGPVSLTEWEADVPAVLSAWYAGQTTGDAIADILSGAVSPGGKLCCTFGNKINDYAPHALKVWPPKLLLDKAPRLAPFDINFRKSIQGYDADYKEGIYMGYRWFDSKNIEPLYPFGHGLSYSTFKIEGSGVYISNSSAQDPAISLKVKVTNTGKQEASEVVQLYVNDSASTVSRPEKELKAFQKVFLKPGESKVVSLKLTKRSFAFWSEKENSWKVEPGEFKLLIGNSSRSTCFTETIILK